MRLLTLAIPFKTFGGIFCTPGCAASQRSFTTLLLLPCSSAGLASKMARKNPATLSVLFLSFFAIEVPHQDLIVSSSGLYIHDYLYSKSLFLALPTPQIVRYVFVNETELLALTPKVCSMLANSLIIVAKCARLLES